MEEWYEYLEELVDYDEFEADLKEEHGLALQEKNWPENVYF